MIDPTEKDVGRAVVYRDKAHPSEPDEGVITSFSDYGVFVRYGSDKHSKLTSRTTLEWVSAHVSAPGGERQ